MSSTSGIDLNQLDAQLKQKDMLEKKQAIDNLRAKLRADMSDEKELREACQGFESIFINKLWKQMRDSLPKEGYLHSREEEAYLSMFDQELANKMSEAGGIGLADMLYEQLKSQTEDASRYTLPSRAREVKEIEPLDPDFFKADTKPFDGTAESLYTPLDQILPQNAEVLPPPAADPAKANNTSVNPQNIMKLAATALAGQIETPRQTPQMRQFEELVKKIEQQGEQAGNEGGPVPLSSDEIKGVPPGPLSMMQWPTEGQVSSNFGWRKDPFTGKKAFHGGIDLAAPEGTPVNACWDGTVIFSGDKGGYGNMVIIEHADGWQSYYGHNSANTVQVGDEVKAGQKIAEVGNTGRSTGPHLHFEIRQDKLAWDPKQIQDRLMAGLPIGGDS